MLDINKIKIDGTQSRTAINDATVAEYAEAIKDGAQFPPVTVFFDGTSYWLADGFHRLLAHKRAGKNEINETREVGGLRDAILFSVGANASHGLRRSNADKRNAVMMMLADNEWSQWSDREIARQCAVSNTFVGNLRAGVNVDSKPEHRPAPAQSVNIDSTEQQPERMPWDDLPEPEREPVAPQKTAEQREIERLEQLLREVTDSLEDALAALADLSNPDQEVYLSEIGKLRAELRATESTRDALQNENAHLKRTLKRLEMDIKK